MARTCPFCSRTANSVEHVDPQWISRYYLDRDAGAGTFTMNFGGLYPERTVPILNQTIHVCRRCNGGWMATLEDRVKPALLAMSAGEGLVIGPAGQRVLAQWLLKNAIARELATPSGSPSRVSTQDQRELVAAGVIPTGWRVAIGGYEGPGSNLVHAFSRAKQLVGDDGQTRGTVILHTLRFECFVAQVLLHSMPQPPDLIHLLGGSQYAVDIPQPSPVVWPPPVVLNAEWMLTVQDFGPTRQ